VQVLKHQDHRRPDRQPGQQPEDPQEQAMPGRAHVTLAVLGQQPFPLVTQRRHERSERQRRSGQRS
jgi:hypothetical protein